MLCHTNAYSRLRVYSYTRICVYVPRGIYRRRLRSLYDTFVCVDTVYKPFAKYFHALSPRSYAMTSTAILRISISSDNRIAQYRSTRQTCETRSFTEVDSARASLFSYSRFDQTKIIANPRTPTTTSIRLLQIAFTPISYEFFSSFPMSFRDSFTNIA